MPCVLVYFVIFQINYDFQGDNLNIELHFPLIHHLQMFKQVSFANYHYCRKFLLDAKHL